jgi:hypothetical protein
MPEYPSLVLMKRALILPLRKSRRGYWHMLPSFGYDSLMLSIRACAATPMSFALQGCMKTVHHP